MASTATDDDDTARQTLPENEEQRARQQQFDNDSQQQHQDHYGSGGTVLEAAFVDPAYQWPPPDGMGKNAIELQASINLLDDNSSIKTTESQRERMKIPNKPTFISIKNSNSSSTHKVKWWNCCGTKGRNNEDDDLGVVRNTNQTTTMKSLADYDQAKRSALQARKLHYAAKKSRAKEQRMKNRYNRVPEGILIYRLDTATHTISLMSEPHEKTDTSTLVKEMIIASARPSPDKSRKGMYITGIDGCVIALVACEQRTAIAWLEAIDMMLANTHRVGDRVGSLSLKSSPPNGGWSKKNLSGKELDQIEGQYLNLASYSNKLIRTATKSSSNTNKNKSGIYYSIEPSPDPLADQFEEEALESIAKRRAVIKDSWDFYRMICSLLRDRRKYSEVFRTLQFDPVYPYLRSMTGLADPGDTSGGGNYENHDKDVIQKDYIKYQTMSRTQVAEALCEQAEQALPSLVEICKALAGSLGMEEVGIGPVKEVHAAMKKAEKKYEGDLLKVTDYCRALLVVKDLPCLLALLELARDSFGPLIRRVKLSSLKADHKPLPGGYRHCIINVELREHICEIQIHLWPMWLVCGVDGFRHYRHCVEYNTDSFENAYDALEGLDRKTMAELIVMAEEAVAEIPLDSLEWFQEKFILDYFAEVGLFLKHGLHVWAEITLRHLVRLRTESPDIGPQHHETILLYKYLEETLVKTGKKSEAKEIKDRLRDNEQRLKSERDEAEKSLWDVVMSAPGEALDMIMDPNKKEREEEEKLRKEVKSSKKKWRMIRKERFSFLDINTASGTGDASGLGSVTTVGMEEKKVDDIPRALAL